MRQSLSLLGLTLTLAPLLAQAQTPAWTAAVQAVNPAPTNDTGALGLDLAVDATGNQYVAGSLMNGAGSGAPATRVFGTTTLTGGGSYGSGFVAKFSPTQQWPWTLKATGTGEGVDFSKVAVSPVSDTYATASVDDDPSISPNGGTVVAVGTYTYTTTRSAATLITRLNASDQL